MKHDHPEIGCYGDGALGHQHTREACATTLAHYVEESFRSRGAAVPTSPDDLVLALRDAMSDDASEELAAEEWLNEHAPFTGAHWGWQDGDFGLWPEESSDERREAQKGMRDDTQQYR